MKNRFISAALCALVAFSCIASPVSASAGQREDSHIQNTMAVPKTTYKITYDANGFGVAPVDATAYAAGAEAVLAGGIAREGYDFRGWNTKKDGTGTHYAAGSKITIQANMTLYATWINYGIIYDANGGTDAPADMARYTSTKQVTIASKGNMARAGYAFTGWNTAANGTGTAYTVGQAYAMTQDLTLFAQWKKITYTVKYDANGATGGNVPVDSSAYDPNAQITVLNQGNLTRTGHTFGGWNLKKDGTGTAYTSGDRFNISGDTTLYAVWKPISYTLTYHANNGTGASFPLKLTALYGAEHQVNDGSQLSRTGYVFTGWNTKADGTGTEYKIGSKVTVKGDTDLYAQWRTNQATLKYEPNGGSGSVPGESKYTIDTRVTLSDGSGLVRSGYAFAGWNTKKDGSGQSYAKGATLTIKEDTVLYAQWRANQATLKYEPNGGSGSVPGESKYTIDTRVTLSDGSGLVRSGYAFAGWNTKKDGSGQSYAKGATLTIKEDTVLYAQWSTNKYKVTYHANNATTGTVPADSTEYAAGAQFTVAGQSNLSRRGYIFKGWSTSPNGGTLYSVGSKVTINSNMTLYARWEATVYRVTYYANGGTGAPPSDTRNYIWDNTVTVLGQGSLSRTGYTFDGWNTKSDGSGQSHKQNGTFTINSNTALYAQWKAIDYKITYNANGGSGTAPKDDATYTSGKIATILGSGSLTRTNYTFMGWSTSASGGSILSANDQIKVTQNVTLYAQWQLTSSLNKYTVTFHSNGGSSVSSVRDIAYNATITEPNAPTKSGYTFGGWYKDNNTFLNRWSFGNTKVIGNTTLYAKWIPVGEGKITIDMHLNQNTDQPKDTRFTFNLVGKNAGTTVYNEDHNVYVSRESGGTWKGSKTITGLDPNLTWTITQRTTSAYQSGSYNISYSSKRDVKGDLTTWAFTVVNTVKTSSGGSSGGGSSTPPYSETFWSDMSKDIKKAKSGTTISMSSAKLDNFPVYILDLIEGKDITIKVTHGGKTIKINGKNMHPIPGNRVYYSFDDLMKLYEKQPTSSTSSKPSTGTTNNNNTTQNANKTPQITQPDNTKNTTTGWSNGAGTNNQATNNGGASGTKPGAAASGSDSEIDLDAVLSDDSKEDKDSEEEDGPGYTIEEPEDPAEQADTSADPAPKRPLGLIIGGILLVVALIGGGVAIVIGIRNKRLNDFEDDDDED